MFTKNQIALLDSADSLLEYGDRDFEYACKFILEETERYQRVFVTEKGPLGGDGGVDLEIRDSNDAVVAYGQCKQWRTRYKGLVASIRELAGCMVRDHVKSGLLLTTVVANDYEKTEAVRCGIEIIDAPVLDAMIQKLNVNVDTSKKQSLIRDEEHRQTIPSKRSRALFSQVIKNVGYGIVLFIGGIVIFLLRAIAEIITEPTETRSRYRKRYRTRKW